MSPRAGAVSVAVVGLLLLAALPAAASGGRSAGAAVIGSARGNAGVAAVPVTPAPQVRPASCPGPSSDWQLLYPGLLAPPAPNASLLGSCSAAPDESGLSFLSPSTASGTRAMVQVQLPPAGTAWSSVAARLSIRTWAGGVSCSMGGAVQVSVDLVPPFSPYVAGPRANWSVMAPAFDLVPAASCDPACSNATAFLVYDGAKVCEEEVVRSGPSSPPTVPTGQFAPGDALSVTLLGGGAGPVPLQVWVNDSTRPSADLAFSYGAAESRLGVPLVPLLSLSSLAGPVWGPTAALSAVVTDCPTPGTGTAACDSYDRATWDGVAPVRLTSVSFWNATAGLYDQPYDQVAAYSSTAACTGGTIACAPGFSGAFYPEWSVYRNAGISGWSFGGRYADTVATLAPPTVGPATAVTPIVYDAPSLQVAAGTATVSQRLTDPAGIASVSFTPSFCSPTLLPAALSNAPGNSSEDGTWSATFPAPGNSGTVPVLTDLTTASGRATGPSVGSADVAGVLPNCLHGPPAPPAGVGATAVADGYLVNWTSVPLGTAYVVLRATAANGSSVNATVAPTSPARLALGTGNRSFNLTAATVDGWNITSPFSLPLLGNVTLPALVASRPTLPAGPIWLGANPVSVNGTVAGGAPPYTVDLAFGDGTSAVIPSTGAWSAGHDFGGYYGDALVGGQVTDAVGDTVALPSQLLPVWATGLGVHATAVGGDGQVEFSWQTPPSPSAPVAQFRIFYSTEPSLASVLTAATDSNATLPGVSVWNTTGSFWAASVPNGGVLFAQVLADNFYGLGQMLAGNAGLLIGRPAPFVLSSISADPGGPAPFRSNLSASAVLGSNDSVASAVYSFPDGSSIPVVPSYVNGTFWLNATFVFPSPGTFVVVLHAVDVFFETQIQTAEVHVSAGLPPALSALVLNAPSYAQSPVLFEATATGGSGLYALNWSFGDGAVGTGTTVSHTYAVSGSYTALITAVDRQTGGATTIVLPITVYAVPTLFVSVTPGPNGSLSYEFRASVGGGSGPSSVVWSFGDGDLGRGNVTTHDYRSTGQYVVNVTATDPAGHAGSTSFTLTANPSGGGGGGGTAGGLSLLDVALTIVAGVLFITILLLSLRRPREPDTTQLAVPAPEDGEVSLT